jgi:hypothetical protein
VIRWGFPWWEGQDCEPEIISDTDCRHSRVLHVFVELNNNTEARRSDKQTGLTLKFRAQESAFNRPPRHVGTIETAPLIGADVNGIDLANCSKH